MADSDFERQILVEVEKWYRRLLRQDGMQDYEEPLFMAVAEWKRNADHIAPKSTQFPPTMLPPPFPPVPRESEIRPRVEPRVGFDLVAMQPERQEDDFSLRATQPVPPNQQAYLVKKMNLPPLPLLKRTS